MFNRLFVADVLNDIEEKIEKLGFNVPDVVISGVKEPERGTAGSAGYDIFSTASFTIKPGESYHIPTGFSITLPLNLFLMVVPRSGLGMKGIQLINTVGIIDCDYVNAPNGGHIWVGLKNSGPKEVEIGFNKGMVQGIIMPYYITENDAVEADRKGGMGSTD